MTSHILDALYAFLLFIMAGFYGYKRDLFKFLTMMTLGSILMNTVAIMMEMKL
jgi:hypothetical protein